MSYPSNIPWAHLCSSEDMIVKGINETALDIEWKSSIAIFKFEPSGQEQIYDGMTVTYLKVAITLTGHISNPDHISGIIETLKNFGSLSKDTITDYQNILSKYHPCYGSILRVLATPKDSTTLKEHYPIFIDLVLRIERCMK